MIGTKPGDTITPASFAVAPELLGRPLARPGQRAAAMAIDLLLVAILANGSGVFFGLAAALALWRASARKEFASRRPKLRRALRLGTAAVLFLVVAGNWRAVTRPFQRLASDSGDSGEGDADAPGAVADSSVHMKANLGDLAALGDVMALRKASNKTDARRSAEKLVKRMKDKGMSAEELGQLEAGLSEGSDSGKAALPPAALAALREVIAAEQPREKEAGAPQALLSPDSLARAYVQALTRGDTTAVGQLRPRLGAAFGADSLAALNGEIHKLSERNRKLRAQVQQDSARQASRPAGLLANAADMSGELLRMLRKAGLGFGWMGLYFTGFVAMMRGQTPGKWIMRIRIVRLDGRPMGWWAALERFGGYAASVVTALSGFFQILWDKNRQAMHDKIAETVVVRV